MARFINFASYNLHGFQQGKLQLLELCNSHEVIAVQEHWLSDYDLVKILNLHDDFSVVAKSAMSEKYKQVFYVEGHLVGLQYWLRSLLPVMLVSLGWIAKTDV